MDMAPLIRKERHEINRHRLLREVTPLACPTAVQQVLVHIISMQHKWVVGCFPCSLHKYLVL